MATLDDSRGPFREACERFSERFYVSFPCLSDPVRRSSLCLKAALLLLHVIIVGFLFVFDRDLMHNIRKMSWFTVMYLVLFVVTLAQYFFTSGSSPGYVLDAMTSENEAHAAFSASSRISFKDNLLQEKMEVQFPPRILIIWEEMLLA